MENSICNIGSLPVVTLCTNGKIVNKILGSP